MMIRAVVTHVPYVRNRLRAYFGFHPLEQAGGKQQSRVDQMALSLLRFMAIGVHAAISFTLIRLGLAGLARGGFLNQNLIYLWFFK